MEALSTSAYISNLPETKPVFKSSLASSQSLCWLCNSPAKRIPKLRTRDGSSHGLRIQALLHNQTPSEGEDNLGKSSEFNFFPGDIFSLSQEKLESVIDVETSLALPQGAGGNRAGLFRTPISGGVQNATSAHALPRPALAVRNLLEQARFAHLCTMMSKMHHRREGYPFGSLVDFAPDRMGHPIFLLSPLAIHTRNLLAEPRCSLVVQMPGWSCLSNARVTLFGDVFLSRSKGFGLFLVQFVSGMAQCARSTLNPSRTPQSFVRTVSAKTPAFASVSFPRTLPEFKKYPVMSCQGKPQSQQEQIPPPQLSLDDLVTSNRKGELLGTIKDSLSNCLSDTNLLETVPGLKSRIKGKVRDIYDAGDYLVLVTTDRLSAFDRNLASIPFKGQVLNETSLWWFNNTQHITPNAIVSSPDKNVVIAKKCSVFTIEFVVRGYVTGSTDTSLWTVYKKGVRNYCGNVISDGLVKNQKLPANILTPTTKAEDHDVPITPNEIVEGGFMTQAEFDEASMKALSLFEFGQRVAKEHGLILVDTKYEFGRSSDGSILLIDEIHTPDSSRYWLAGSYEERFQKGLEPENVDKEFIRLWFKENCNPYEDEVLPAAPAELVTELAWRYIFLYETITGSRIDILPTQEPIHDRISRNTSQALSSLRQL